MTASFAALVLAALAAPVGAQSKAGNDAIRRTNGQTIRRAEVLSETLAEVKYKSRGKEHSIPAADVRDIEWGDAGETYGRAVFAASRREYATAADLFQEAAGTTDRKALEAHATFRAARSLYLASTTDRSKAPLAARALAAWVGAHPEHRLMPEARHLLGQARLVAGEVDEALAAFKELEEVAGAKNLGAAWIARAKFGQAEALVKKKDFANARSSYVSASATLSTVDPAQDPTVGELLIAAKVGEGECYVAEKRYREAEAFFDRLATQGRANPGLAAAAACGAAQAVFEAALAKNDRPGLRRAEIQLARVSATDIMDGETSAKALYYLGRTILAIGKKGEGPNFAGRAAALFRNVSEQYPNTHWAVRARQALVAK